MKRKDLDRLDKAMNIFLENLKKCPRLNEMDCRLKLLEVYATIIDYRQKDS